MTYEGRNSRTIIAPQNANIGSARPYPFEQLSFIDEPLGGDNDSHAGLHPISQGAIPDEDDNFIAQISLRIDVSRVLQKLTPREKEICHLLGEGGLTLAQVARLLKIRQGTISRDRDRIKKIFEKEGLREYLD